VGWNNVAGIVIGYGLDGPGVEFQWGRDFPQPSRQAFDPTSLLYIGCRL